LRVGKFNSADEAGGSDAVNDAIDEAMIEVTNDYGDPTKRSTFIVDSTQSKYEFRVDNKKTYRVDLVIIRDDNNNRITYTAASTASESSQTYVQDLEFNTITFSSATIAARNGLRVEVQYVPNEFHHLCASKGALYLLDRTNTQNSEEGTPTLGLRLLQRIQRIEGAIQPFIGVGSEDNKHYDPTRGEDIPQRRFRTY